MYLCQQLSSRQGAGWGALVPLPSPPAPASALPLGEEQRASQRKELGRQSSSATAPAKHFRTCSSDARSLGALLSENVAQWHFRWGGGSGAPRLSVASRPGGNPAPAGTWSLGTSCRAAAAALVLVKCGGFLWWRCTCRTKYSLPCH